MKRWWKKLVEWWKGEPYFSEVKVSEETQWVRFGPNMEVEVPAGVPGLDTYRHSIAYGHNQPIFHPDDDWYRLEPSPILDGLADRRAKAEELLKKLNS